VEIPASVKLNQDQKDRIVAELNRRTATKSCARCGNPNFSLLDVIFTNPAAVGLPGFVATPTVPTVAVACTRCGALYHHLLGMLVSLQEFGLG